MQDARLNETGDAGLDEGEEDYVSEDDVDDNLHDQVHGLTSSRTTAHKKEPHQGVMKLLALNMMLL